MIRRVWQWPLILLVILVQAVASWAADVQYYFVAKGKEFSQNSSTIVVPKGSPARFNAFVGLSVTNSATNATVQSLPSGAVIPLTLGVGRKAGVLDTFSHQAKYTSQSLLDAAYPDGNYQMVIGAVHDGIKTLTLALNGDTYPTNAPTITNPYDPAYNFPVISNTAAPFTLTWTPWSAGTVNDYVQVTLTDIAGNPFYVTPSPGQPNALNGTAKSLIIPAKTLPSGSLIGGSLVFAKVVQSNTTAYAGVPGYAAYYAGTTFGIVTLAQDVAFYNLTKQQTFNQTNSGAPTLIPGPAFRFLAQVFATVPNSVISAQVQPPAPAAADPLSPDPTGTLFAFVQKFPSQAALDAAFVSGSYTLQISATNDGNKVLAMTLPADSFPGAPHVSNWAAAQSVNAGTDFKLTWDAFSGATALDDIVVLASDSLGNTVVGTNLVTSSTSLDLPAGTFQSGQSYQFLLQFRHFVSQDTTSYPGAFGAVRFISRTFFNLSTTGGASPPMLATANTNNSGPFQLLLTGQAGSLFAIDASTNLQSGSWVPLITNTAVGGQFIFTDTRSSNFPVRFYRGRAAN